MKHPHVLLVCVDHWPGSYLGSAGHPCIMTPTLDMLAANGVRFSNAYSATPMCVPARRALMTGATARMHGDRVFASVEMPSGLPTLAQSFRDAGYQAQAVGKLHVHPQRDRIGFDDVILHEEGRHEHGMMRDDYEQFLVDQGYAGQEMTHGISNNEYLVRSWHLPEHCHPTHWAVREMCRTIQRRNPRKPGFWYLSFMHPHPPLVPPAAYMDLYEGVEIPVPVMGAWARDFESLPANLKARTNKFADLKEHEMRLARRAFYAQCTYIDHQLRLVIGQLREEKLLDETLILFTSDHGDMLGNHGQYAKSLFYEDSARVPFILVPTLEQKQRIACNRVDDRIVELRDVMPTLLDLAGIPCKTEGLSVVGNCRREHLYGEVFTDAKTASRMLLHGRHKLIYYPMGNRLQLFDLSKDPCEMKDESENPAYQEMRDRLVGLLMAEFYGEDGRWVKDGKLMGVPDMPFQPEPSRSFGNQRGWRLGSGSSGVIGA